MVLGMRSWACLVLIYHQQSEEQEKEGQPIPGTDLGTAAAEARGSECMLLQKRLTMLAEKGEISCPISVFRMVSLCSSWNGKARVFSILSTHDGGSAQSSEPKNSHSREA